MVMVAAKRNMAAGRTSGMGGYLQFASSKGRGAADVTVEDEPRPSPGLAVT